MLFVGMFVDKTFIFSASLLIVFKAWFLRGGNAVFSDIILFIISTFFFLLALTFVLRLVVVIFRSLLTFPFR